MVFGISEYQARSIASNSNIPFIWITKIYLLDSCIFSFLLKAKEDAFVLSWAIAYSCDVEERFILIIFTESMLERVYVAKVGEFKLKYCRVRRRLRIILK